MAQVEKVEELEKVIEELTSELEIRIIRMRSACQELIVDSETVRDQAQAGLEALLRWESFIAPVVEEIRELEDGDAAARLLGDES